MPSKKKLSFLRWTKGGIGGLFMGKYAHNRHEKEQEEKFGEMVAAAVEEEEEQEELVEDGCCGRGQWESLPIELLMNVIQRVEAREGSWPGRRQVVACAAVCRSWRKATLEVVRDVEQSGRITFPISLKQPGPRESPIQCFIRRERATSTYFLYLGVSPALSADTGKMLFAAHKIRRAACTEFTISMASGDFSQASSVYVGKLRSNFHGTKFTVHNNSQPPYNSSIGSYKSTRQRIHSKQVFPKFSSGNHAVATITYELNALRTRGPRKMLCTMNTIPISVIQEDRKTPTSAILQHSLDERCSPSFFPVTRVCSNGIVESSRTLLKPLVLKNKAPKWHEQLQCWCLNFQGRVTVASVKNFQLVAALELSDQVSVAQHEKVILQFGKVGKDFFTMDYHYPISAFEAFAICLSSFDTKPTSERM